MGDVFWGRNAGGDSVAADPPERTERAGRREGEVGKAGNLVGWKWEEGEGDKAFCSPLPVRDPPYTVGGPIQRKLSGYGILTSASAAHSPPPRWLPPRRSSSSPAPWRFPPAVGPAPPWPGRSPTRAPSTWKTASGKSLNI